MDRREMTVTTPEGLALPSHAWSEKTSAHLLTIASVLVIALMPPEENDWWWLKPTLVVVSAGSLYKVKSPLAGPVLVLGLVLMIRNYKRWKIRQVKHEIAERAFDLHL